MIRHVAKVHWRSDGGPFERGRFSRNHTWQFDGGTLVAASASPAVVRPPFVDEKAVDPEEALVAALASCHMLTFLYEASRQGHPVVEYSDDAYGVLEKNEHGVYWVSQVHLAPVVRFAPGHPMSSEALAILHERAHSGCFIANSVRSAVFIEPRATPLE